MNTKFFFLLAVALLISTATSTASHNENISLSLVEFQMLPTIAAAIESHHAGEFPVEHHPVKHSKHVEKKHTHHEEDGTHDHISTGRFRRRQRFALWLCRLSVAVAYFGCFCYCFKHLTHTCFFQFLSDVFAKIFC